MNQNISRKSRKISHSEKNVDRPTHPRINIIFFLFLLIAALILYRLYCLQVLSYPYYKGLAHNQHSIFKNLVPKRGEIYLKEGQELYPAAVNKDADILYAVPAEIKDLEKAVIFIAETLKIDVGELRTKLGDRDDMYEPIKRKLSENEVAEFKKADMEGLYISQESYRYYPAGELASQVLGFVGWSENEYSGRYGVENYFESVLAGRPGQLFQTKDNAGLWVGIGAKEIEHAQNGDTLMLTIDHIIQYEAEKILRNAIERFEAEKGSVIVMETATGKILALANHPGFDPNQYGKFPMENFRNLAVSEPYECGSVFKPITIASAIDAGKINPETTYKDTGMVVEAGYEIKNSDEKANGIQTMTQVLEKSLNTGVIYAEKLLGNINFADYVERFGFGATTDIDLPSESLGNISSLKNHKRTINFYTASFGQGITVTPIQLVNAFNAIANDGTLLKPQIIEKIVRSDGSEEVKKTEEIRKVISASSARLTSEMLVKVVKNGHGKLAGVPGYLVGGKTGTAQVAHSSAKGYEEGKHIGSFVGFAPADDPVFTMLVRIDNPKNVEWAESSAAPIFGELMSFMLDYRNIMPTEEYTQQELDRFNQTHTLREYVPKEKERKKDKDNPDEKSDE